MDLNNSINAMSEIIISAYLHFTLMMCVLLNRGNIFSLKIILSYKTQYITYTSCYEAEL